MRAAFIEAPGPAEAIRIGELAVPVPGPTDALVAVAATAVNHVDAYVRAGRYPTLLPLPFVVGRDLVGTVVEAGPGAGVAVGDRVWCNSLGYGGRQGACAEYAVAPGERLYPLPRRIALPVPRAWSTSDERPSGSLPSSDPAPSSRVGDLDPRVDALAAVAVLHNAATAWLGLHRRARVRAGDTVFVGGGAGNLGSVVTQLAAEAGLRVIASARRADLERCRRLGAAVAVDYRDPDLVGRVREAAPAGVDLWWDTSGRGDLAPAVEALAPGGRILVTAHVGADPVLPGAGLYTNDRGVIGFVISRATVDELADAARAINRRLDGGGGSGGGHGDGLAVHVSRVVGLARTAEAHAAVEAAVPGRIVITPASPGPSDRG
jgi:NADPH:quinone reductase-like Zn-dependent oxidoreductase